MLTTSLHQGIAGGVLTSSLHRGIAGDRLTSSLHRGIAGEPSLQHPARTVRTVRMLQKDFNTETLIRRWRARLDHEGAGRRREGGGIKGGIERGERREVERGVGDGGEGGAGNKEL